MMDKSAADAYVYAKVSGILANSYSGKNADKLYSAKSLTELYSLLFKTEVPSIPENLLAKKIEEKSVFNFVEQYCQLVECYAHPQKILLTLLRLYDYSNLKMLAGALCMQETKCPEDRFGKVFSPKLQKLAESCKNYRKWRTFLV